MPATQPPGQSWPGVFAAWWGGRPLAQLGLLAGVAAIFAFFGANTVDSMHRLGLSVGFGFLSRPANFEIGESLIAYGASDSYGRAILAGLLNTVLVASLGCLLATAFGVAVALARLSGNVLLAGLAQVYVELVRNTPLLLQLFFWSATVHALPGPRQALSPLAGIYLTNRGVYLPGLQADWAGFSLVWLASLILCAGIWRIRRRLGPGALATALAAAAAGPTAVAIAAGLPLVLDAPTLRGFNFAGGLNLSPEFAALLTGLVVNSAAGIAEIVRGGILAIPAGQWEAGRAIGLPRRHILRLIILPQAVRLILPVMTSSYLSLTKNSSLAVAIGFPDLVSVVNTSANQTGQVLEAIAIMMAIYLGLSLAVSAAMNAYNRRLAARVAR